ncbi:MAG: hypothetical protein KGJ79_02225 [Alphaproteobacteria bacterium]|nr:hypothetical protein [Alphaproteobacteria bacterium]MDE2496083.1 hypothetical protein [Alphaproteobacteria bacterium]
MGLQSSVDVPCITSAAAANDLAQRRGWPMLYDATCQFRHAKLKDLHALWCAMAERDGDIPYRLEMTARLLQPYMRMLVLFERVVAAGSSRRYRVRLMGSSLVEALQDMTGRFLDEALPGRYLPRWYMKNDITLATGAPLRMLVRGDTFDRSYLVGEYICVPLRAGGGEISLVLAAAYFDGTRPWTELAAEECQRLGLELPACV